MSKALMGLRRGLMSRAILFQRWMEGDGWTRTGNSLDGAKHCLRYTNASIHSSCCLAYTVTYLVVQNVQNACHAVSHVHAHLLQLLLWSQLVGVSALLLSAVGCSWWKTGLHSVSMPSYLTISFDSRSTFGRSSCRSCTC